MSCRTDQTHRRQIWGFFQIEKNEDNGNECILHEIIAVMNHGLWEQWRENQEPENAKEQKESASESRSVVSDSLRPHGQ